MSMSLLRCACVLTVAILLLSGCSGKKAETESEQNAKGPAGDVAVIETRLGTIVLEFYPDIAPNHVENFKKLAQSGFYDSNTFHRVIPGFVIQGGDPNTKDDDRNNDGMGGPGYSIEAEFNQRPHLRGTLSMARSQDPNSAGSQFFICVAPLPNLDGKYTVFGNTIRGMEVVDQIVNLPRDNMNNPLEAVPMTVSIVPRSSIE
jgi:peptidyl-prolyl cis-trans isomerase B (cyclophilin B)